MTIREYLNNKKKKYFSAAFISWGVCAITLIAMVIIETNMLFYFILLLSSFLAGELFLFYPYWGVRCPNCKNKLGFIFFRYNKNLFSISDKFGFCLYCGVNLNSEIKIRNK